MRFLNKTMLTVLAIGLLAVNCDSLLDTEPAQSIDGSIALETEANVLTVLNGAYDGFSDDDMFGGQIQMEADLMANDNSDPELRWVGTFEEPEQIWRKQILLENTQVSQTWTESYDAINRANNVLSALDVIEDAATRTQVEAEAKFIRGVSYFYLVQFFGKPFSDGNAASNPGVPLVLTPTTGIDETSNVSRNTVAEVYAQVLSDLTDAEAGLPASNGGYATSHAAAAFLSRVYLQQGNYAGARDAANRVISSGAFSLTATYVGAFNNAENSTEDVFAIQVDAQDGAHSLNTFFAHPDAGGRGDITISPTHLALYEAGDERIDAMRSDSTATEKWDDFTANIPVIRLAEMYLTRAEANQRLTTVVGATPLADINTIRARVGLPALLTVDVDAILAERKLELAFEGQILHDLRRTQQNIGSFAYDANETVWPIPQREMDVNSNLTQNPGYTGN
ncbi:MAG: RagB/SusD family nutrient uptake outer membrane protein [Balneolaceae bacterium]|nr:RagB/SusD family nutrient uptake outer membrane protein [Balneolaceae bacterium]MBO6545054.1 RagB/SusD family nutrient uptake outer membrane protein [Balneolaceae bacterium]MBO6646450.1 RagB/SusD family nutrient uptake outer membrane protein [Balneolaceae bacterium]